MRLIILVFMITLHGSSAVFAFHIDNLTLKYAKGQQKISTLPVQNFFIEAQPDYAGAEVIVDPLCLLQVAKDVLHHFKSRGFEDDPLIDPVDFRPLLLPKLVRKTLQFLIELIEQDKDSGTFRILDPKFLEDNFGMLRWDADWKSACANHVKMPHDGRIRLTSYGMWTVKGSRKKTADYPCGLYFLLDNAIAKKYTKHQILAGVLEKPENRFKRKALAWVSRQDLEDALMQGTIVVEFPDGERKVLKIEQHNGIPFVWQQKNVLAQKRYWFFKEFEIPAKSKASTVRHLTLRKNVIFAGDLSHMGVGKLIAIRYQNPITKKEELRLGLLADTGGAFQNNLYQLDLFAGVFENRAALKGHLRLLPPAVNAYILYKK